MSSYFSIYLVKSIKLQIGAVGMLGKEEWMEFIIAVSRYHHNKLTDITIIWNKTAKNSKLSMSPTGHTWAVLHWVCQELSLVSSLSFEWCNPLIRQSRICECMKFKTWSQSSQIPQQKGQKWRSLTLPVKLSVLSMYVSAICRASSILGATENR